MKRTVYYIAIVALLMLTAPVATQINSKKVSTRVTPPKGYSPNPKNLRTYPYNKSEFETVTEKLAFLAYDKKAGAGSETFFVDNGSKVTLNAIELEISYFTTSDKLIHKRTVELSQNFPANETRKVDIKSWDTQRSFHYINSVPSTKGSTPYTVKFRVLSFVKS